ncbi:Congested-like trachea protein [Seminavis robusta]|uniref:Congested-like trachea protein n=1 Tax=Seminavis robusta TaxID=568900 RepID=A0A9N8D8I2_9STRA|nr:Congested-like trachea protein [Seminavis robusta]|eukprot:Sro2_g001450.1 Congested-like trachea protein (313) ;mRNA; r:156085-157304
MSEVSLASGLMEFAPGAIGGFCNVFVGHPMDLIKVRQQSVPMGGGGGASVSRTAVAAALASNTSTSAMFRNIIAQEGMSGLYRGLSSPLIAVTPAFAVNFWSFDVAKNFIIKQQQQNANSNEEVPVQLSIAQISLAGAFSGICLGGVIGPSERIKCLMQVDKQRYSGFFDCARQVYKEGGLASVFRGTGSAILRDVPGNAAYFGAYELFKRQLCVWEERDTPSTRAILLAGGMSGVANWIVAIPFDTIKSRIQTAPAGRYRNYVDVLRQTIQQEGFQALFRGLTPALLRAFPANAACLLGVESARTFFASIR